MKIIIDARKILKQTQGYFEEKSPSFKEADGEWINNDDIFNKTVEEVWFYNPEYIDNNPDLQEAKNWYNIFQQTLKKLIIIMISSKKFLNNINRWLNHFSKNMINEKEIWNFIFIK